LQREIGKYQSAVIVDFQTAPFDIVWPWVKNWGVWRLARAGTEKEFLWVDESLKT
jgi:hypothetical protein